MESKEVKMDDGEGALPPMRQPVVSGSELTMEDVFSVDEVDLLEIFGFSELYDWE